MSIVSNNIKYLRRLNGLTQEQFARKIGIKRSLLGAYEEARANPNLTNLKNMAATFGVSVDNLLKNDLRKIRETPQLNALGNHISTVPSPLLREPVQEPASLATIMNSRPLPAQDLPQTTPRPITFPSSNFIDFDSDIEEKKTVAAPVRLEETLFRQPMPEPKPVMPVVEKKEPDFFSPTSLPKTIPHGVPLIPKDKELLYLSHLYDTTFLQKLPVIQLPGLTEGTYRGFEAGADFPMPETLLVGQRLQTIHEMVDGQTYLLVLKNEGSVYRRVFNQIRVKGVVALFSDVAGVPNTEVSARDVAEVYQIVWFVCKQMSLPQQIDLHRVKELVNELQKEIQHTIS